ncbi:unnamed protein product (macronuclear) [Paramecium tetraurelia]|uniref:Uncharacterized protein n=1 Tax=Paramecium tetraurelia TaxID=5888 RepID=A0CN71_PARTE|nr:uncharacterized protein GSPATT00008679001 [Paramecium tetraurelia]CAK72238.1 unnamed protein product [Paramecium tetraurelia]|eukprot:XP_001439635.1 hypothetical protein (macronuclear) [Paramecium tetraurelia strain d4-2]
MIQKVVQLVQRRSIQRFSSVFVAHRNRDDNSDSVPFDFTDENYKKIEGILSKFPSNEKKSGTIPLLMLAQKQNNNFLSLSAMKKIAKILEIPEMDVFETASFYSMFNRERVGKFHLQVCGTTPCQLCGSKDIIKAIEQQLNIKNGETSADGLFTLQEVECLGACANAPMMQVNNEWVYEDLTPENTLKLLEDLKNGTDKKGPQNGRKNAEGPQGRTTLQNIANQQDIKYDRNFEAAKKEWLDQKEKERLEAEKKKQAAQQAKK